MKIALLSFLILCTFGACAQTKKETPTKENCGPVINKNKAIKAMTTNQKNVLGTALELACTEPMTGYFRTGFCSTDENDYGVHVVAAVVTDEFLEYSKAKGNDLITPYPASGFPGLKAGDTWCLCAMRWREAFEAGVAPPVVLNATNKKALDFIKIEDLKSKAVGK